MSLQSEIITEDVSDEHDKNSTNPHNSSARIFCTFFVI